MRPTLRMQDTSYVLKGGTALALRYGLDRHSDDLDFDGAKAVSIKRCVRDGFKDANVSMISFKPGDITWKGQRFKVHYADPQDGRDCLMRVELSFRGQPRADEIVIFDGIRTYKTPAQFDQKMSAAGDRTKARDLYDLGFLAGTFGDRFSDQQVRRAEEFSRDYEDLADRYRQASNEDELLSDLTTADERALIFRIAIIEQMYRRGQFVVEQAVPRARSLAEILAAHKIWLECRWPGGSSRGSWRLETHRLRTMRSELRESRSA